MMFEWKTQILIAHQKEGVDCTKKLQLEAKQVPLGTRHGHLHTGQLSLHFFRQVTGLELETWDTNHNLGTDFLDHDDPKKFRSRSI